MLKVLLKKQLLEINRSFFYNQKTNQARSRGSIVAFILLYALLMVGVIGGSLAGLGILLCRPLIEAGASWFYFTLYLGVALLLGVFGSVFSTYSGLYLSRDNDMLLSLPIPIRDIMLSRLLGVYLMGLMFSGVAFIPGLLIYLIVLPGHVGHWLAGLLTMVLLSLFVLTLSCLLGWVVAKVSLRLKRKSLLAVFAALLFFVFYYFVCFNSGEWIEQLLNYLTENPDALHGVPYLLTVPGRAAAGEPFPLLIVIVTVLALFALTCYILSRSFLKIATSSQKVERVKSVEKIAAPRSLPAALLAKEVRRFLSSTGYMLNCGMGTFFLIVIGILLLVQAGNLSLFLSEMPAGIPPVLLTGGLCLVSTMNDITAPSVSLDAKTLWIAGSLPIPTWQILRAKLSLSLLLTCPPLLFASVAAIPVLRPDVAVAIALLLIPQIFALLSAEFGLMLDLWRPNLTWTNEITPLKQNASVMIALLGGWGIVVLLTVPAAVLAAFLPAAVPMFILLAINGTLAFLLYRWLKTRGVERYTAL